MALLAHALALLLLGVSPAVAPTSGGRYQPFAVSITTRRATGVFGQTRRSYIAFARAVHGHAACVVDRDPVFPVASAGRRVRAVLDPARGEGGELGWCPGRFRGKVTYFEGFACPPKGVCKPPPGFPKHHRVVARFCFRVR